MTPMQRTYWLVSFAGLALAGVMLYFSIWGGYALGAVVMAYFIVGLYDCFWSPHTLNRLYPVAAYIRYFLEYIRPEIRQYFIASNTDERPFNREMRSLVYARSKGQQDTLPFGSERDQSLAGFYSVRHSLLPCQVDEAESRVIIGNEQCTQPYSASRLNISGMSFGALSANAISALNKGAAMGGFSHNTGEGGISPYHQLGADLVWQIGTSYFGCRTPEGHFCERQFGEKAKQDTVKMIELKLSQGAKPAHGGILPASKINDEIALIRGVNLGEDCISPPAHESLSSPGDILEFIARLRLLSGGKPVGFKLCIGDPVEFMCLCKAMLDKNIFPDFITVDGGEGGTGAAPVEFSNRLGMLCSESVHFVHNCLVGLGLKSRIKIIASGKTASGFDLLEKVAVGADVVCSARTMMFALGCIQALSCNTNHCPTGIATQDPKRSKALDVGLKSKRVYNFHKSTIHSFFDLVGAMGLSDPDDLHAGHLVRRMDDGTTKRYDEIHDTLSINSILENTAPKAYLRWWASASEESFKVV